MASRIWSSLPNSHTHIRVAAILPSADSNAQLDCKLFVLPLNQCGVRFDFAALSYACGDVSDTTPLIVNGLGYPGLSSMVAALRCLRHNTDPRAIWVDQLCINQYDNKERSDQIMLMKEIYSKAGVVHIFLGASEQDIDTSEVMRYLGILVTQRNRITESFPGAIELEQCLRCIVSFTRRSYWTRTWTLQEVMLSKSCRLHWGEHSIPWNSDICASVGLRLVLVDSNPFESYPNSAVLDKLYDEALLSFRDINDRSAYSRHILNLNQEVDAIPTSETSRRILGQARLVRVFCDFVFKCRTLDTSDPRDKVYGLLGLAPTAFSNAIRPDHNQDLAMVYANYTFATIIHTKSLMPIRQSWIGESKIETMMRSWVPDLAQTMTKEDLSRMHDINLQWGHFKAGSPLCLEAKLVGNNRVLRLRGRLVDIVSEVVPIEKGESPQRPLSACQRLAGRQFSRYVAGGSTHYAFYQTLTVGSEIQSDIDDYWTPRKTPIAKWTWKHYRWKIIHWWKAFSRLWNIRASLGATSPLNGWSDACFFKTERGYMGITWLTEVHQADVIAVLDGARLPFILRKSEQGLEILGGIANNTFNFVAPAYVHAVMEGEIFLEMSPIYVESKWDMVRRWGFGGKRPDVEMKTRESQPILLV